MKPFWAHYAGRYYRTSRLAGWLSSWCGSCGGRLGYGGCQHGGGPRGRSGACGRFGWGVALLPSPPAAGYEAKEQGGGSGQLQHHEAVPVARASGGQGGRRLLHPAAQTLLQLG